VLAVGLFANGNPDTAAWNGVCTPVTGLFYGGGTQLIAQALEVIAVFITVFGLSYLVFAALKRAGLLRSRAEDEIGGLDIPEMGSPGYVAGDISVPGGEVAGPTPVPSSVTSPAG
jgi:Amt family ammonium transporter